MSDAASVVVIGDFAFERARRAALRAETACRHRKLTMDDDGDIVMCTDCGKQVSAFWALAAVVDGVRRVQREVAFERERLKREMSETIVHRACVLLQRAWRSRSMVPGCPHCSRGILATDNLGAFMTNRAIEMRAREAERS